MARKTNGSTVEESPWSVTSGKVRLGDIDADDSWNMRNKGKPGVGVVSLVRNWIEMHRKEVGAPECPDWAAVQERWHFQLPSGVLELRDSLLQTRADDGTLSGLIPVIVCIDGDVTRLCAGFRRVAAAWLASPDGDMVLDVRIVPLARAREVNMIENIHRENPSPPEMAEGIFALREERSDLSFSDIAFRLGLSRKYVEALVRVKKSLAKEVWTSWLAEPSKWSRHFLEEHICPLPKSEQFAAATMPAPRAPKTKKPVAEIETFHVPVGRLKDFRKKLGELMERRAPFKEAQDWTPDERRVFALGAKWADDTYNMVDSAE